MFLVCEIPHRFLYIYIAHNTNRQIGVHEYLVISFVSYFLYPLQSTLNPLLYSMVDTTWKKTLYKYWICARRSMCGTESQSQTSTLKTNSNVNHHNEKIIVHTLEHHFELELALIQSDPINH